MTAHLLAGDRDETTRSLCVLVVLCLLTGSAPEISAAEIVLTPQDDVSRRLKQVTAGDVVILTNGEWRDFSCRLEARGTADQPVIVRAETPGGVVFTGASQLEFSGSHITVSGLVFRGISSTDTIRFRTHSARLAHHCRLTQCALIGDARPGVSVEQRWVSIYGTHNRVDHCDFAGKATAGTTLVVWVGEGANDHRIDHNHFGPRPPLGRNGGEAIRVGTSDVSLNPSRTVVEDNLFVECDGEAEIVSNKSCENIYRRNTFRRCSGALTLRHGDRCRVEENYFLGAGARGCGGVRVIGRDHVVVNNYFADLTGDEARSALSFMNGLIDSPLSGYAQVENAFVAFNTFVDCKVAVAIGVGAGPKQPLTPRNCVFANNVLIGRRNEFRRHDEPEEWREVGTVRVGDAADLTYLQDDAGIWRPTASSPNVDTAVSLSADVDSDIDGQMRLPPRDAGCDELGSPQRPPLTATDVGPDWLAAGDRLPR